MEWKNFFFIILPFVTTSVVAVPLSERWSIIDFKKCYGELGCFSIGTDFMDLKNRPIQVFPQSREEVNTKFRLFTRLSSINGHEIKVHDLWLLGKAPFEENKPVIFITHGFLESAKATWVYNIRRDLLLHGDYNVIETDWENGATQLYTQSTANSRLVGAEIAVLLKFLKKNVKGFDYSKVHLIGHSLGAHASGYAGKRFPTDKLGRITGLDPAGPYFEGTKPIMRIDRGDATFVDIIHTNGVSLLKAGFGMFQPVGHVDIYVNGGKHQHGCSPSKAIDNLKDRGVVETIACSHMRVVHLFRSTILSHCPFKAFKCNDYESFKAGRCLRCRDEGSCITIGQNTTKLEAFSESRYNKYYLETSALPPYCGYHYGVTINFKNSTEPYTGRFYVKLNNPLGETNRLAIPGDDKWHKIEPGRNVSGIIFFDESQGNIDNLSFEWKRKTSIWEPGSWVGSSKVEITSIDVFNAVTQTNQRYCSEMTLKTGKTHIFIKC